MRTTRKDLAGLVDLLNENWPHADGGAYFVQWAYGRPRLMRYAGHTTAVHDVSPRLPSGQLAEWMQAFFQGAQVGFEGGKGKPNTAALLAD